MVQPPVKKVRVVRRLGESADRVIAAVTDPAWAQRARVVKEDERSSVLVGEADGREVVVKTVRVGGARRWFGRTRLGRELRGALLLRRTGLRTPDHVALLRGFEPGVGNVESLLYAHVEGRTLLRCMRDMDMTVREQHRLAHRVGEDIERLERARLFNRDHKPSNIIVQRDGNEFRLVYIDTGGVRRSGTNRSDEMLAKLLIEAAGVGCQPRRALQVRALRSLHEARHGGFDEDAFVTDTVNVRGLCRAHGDPTPKDDPLGYDRRLMRSGSGA